jgi:hypothetical protein
MWYVDYTKENLGILTNLIRRSVASKSLSDENYLDLVIENISLSLNLGFFIFNDPPSSEEGDDDE